MPPPTGAATEARSAESVGRRSARAGFVVEAARALLAACDTADPDAHNEALAALLRAEECWVGAVEPGGALHALLQEQDGELCGPRPPRADPMQDSGEVMGGLGALPGGTILTGPQLLALLDAGALPGDGRA